MKNVEAVKIVHDFLDSASSSDERRFIIRIAEKGKSQCDTWGSETKSGLLIFCEKYLQTSSFLNNYEFWVEDTKTKNSSSRFHFDDPSNIGRDFKEYKNPTIPNNKDANAVKIINDFFSACNSTHFSIYKNGQNHWSIPRHELKNLINSIIESSQWRGDLRLYSNDTDQFSEIFCLSGNKIDFSLYEKANIMMNEKSKHSVKTINSYIAERPNFDFRVVKGYKNGVHTWNWTQLSFKENLANLFTAGNCVSTDVIQIETSGSGAGISDRFYITEKLNFAEKNSVMTEKGTNMSTKAIAKTSALESFEQFKEGAKVRMVHNVGGNLVTAVSSLIPSAEAQNLFANEYVRTGTQGVLAFLLTVFCEEGVIPAKARPFVKKACERQLEAAGFELAGPLMEQILPLTSLLMDQLVEAGKSMMSEDEIAEAEKEIARETGVKARTFDEVDIEVEEEQEEEREVRKTVAA